MMHYPAEKTGWFGAGIVWWSISDLIREFLTVISRCLQHCQKAPLTIHTYIFKKTYFKIYFDII